LAEPFVTVSGKILLALRQRRLGVRQLHRSLGGSPETIVARLRELEGAGLIRRKPGRGPHPSAIGLTERGREAARALEALARLSE